MNNNNNGKRSYGLDCANNNSQNWDKNLQKQGNFFAREEEHFLVKKTFISINIVTFTPLRFIAL